MPLKHIPSQIGYLLTAVRKLSFCSYDLIISVSLHSHRQEPPTSVMHIVASKKEL